MVFQRSLKRESFSKFNFFAQNQSRTCQDTLQNGLNAFQLRYYGAVVYSSSKWSISQRRPVKFSQLQPYRSNCDSSKHEEPTILHNESHLEFNCNNKNIKRRQPHKFSAVFLIKKLSLLQSQLKSFYLYQCRLSRYITIIQCLNNNDMTREIRQSTFFIWLACQMHNSNSPFWLLPQKQTDLRLELKLESFRYRSISQTGTVHYDFQH